MGIRELGLPGTGIDRQRLLISQRGTANESPMSLPLHRDSSAQQSPRCAPDGMSEIVSPLPVVAGSI